MHMPGLPYAICTWALLRHTASSVSGSQSGSARTHKGGEQHRASCPRSTGRALPALTPAPNPDRLRPGEKIRPPTTRRIRSSNSRVVIGKAARSCLSQSGSPGRAGQRPNPQVAAMPPPAVQDPQTLGSVMSAGVKCTLATLATAPPFVGQREIARDRSIHDRIVKESPRNKAQVRITALACAHADQSPRFIRRRAQGVR
jgi:hypothetical protein